MPSGLERFHQRLAEHMDRNFVIIINTVYPVFHKINKFNEMNKNMR